MNIAVVDTNGELVHFLRMDGAQIASVNVSIGNPPLLSQPDQTT
jgi:glc operon protein GlcG